MFGDEEARRIVERSQDEGLDRLWMELLESSWGAYLLDVWDRTVSDFQATRRALAPATDRVLTWAQRMLGMGRETFCAEYALGGLLCHSNSDLVSYLRGRGLEPRALEAEWLALLEEQLDRHSYDHAAACRAAHRNGRDEPSQAEVLEEARLASPLVARWLESWAIPYLEFSAPHYHSSWAHEPIRAEHLAQACLKIPELRAWLERSGLTWTQARRAIYWRHFDADYAVSSQNSHAPWMLPACEEAWLEGSPAVSLRHFFQALLSCDDSLVARTLQDCGLERRAWLRELRGPVAVERVPVAQMAFTSEATQVYARAAERHGSRNPGSGFLLAEALALECPAPWPRERLQKCLEARLQGNLPQDLSRLDVDGIRLGMSLEQVREILGEPGRSAETEDGQQRVSFADLTVVLAGQQVSAVYGDSLRLDGAEVLRNGDSLDRAERCLGARFTRDLGAGIQAFALVLSGRVHGVWLLDRQVA